MNRSLNVLLVLDGDDDERQILGLLEAAPQGVNGQRIRDDHQPDEALAGSDWDVAIYALPSGPPAPESPLDWLQNRAPDLPVIVWHQPEETERALGLFSGSVCDIIDARAPARLLPAVLREAEQANARRLARLDLDRHTRLLTSISDALIVDDSEGRVVFANDRFLELFGFTRNELPDIRLTDYVAPEYVALLEDRHLRRVAGGSVPDRFEYEGVRRDGKRLWLEVKVARVMEEGVCIGTQSTITDITERRRAEKTERALRDIAEAALHAADLPDLYGRIHCIIDGLLPAPNFYVALYDDTTDLVSFPYFLDEYDDAPSPQPLDDISLTAIVLKSGKPKLIALVNPTEGAETQLLSVVGARPAEWLGVPLISRGKTIGVLAVQSYTGEAHYSTQHRELLEFVSAHVAAAIRSAQATDAIRESEAKYRALFDQSPDIITLATFPDGVIVDASRTAIDQFGGERSNLIGLTPRELAAWVKPEERQAFVDLLTEHGVVQLFEATLQIPGRPPFPALLSSTLVTISGQRYSINIVKDVSEIRRTEALLLNERNFSNVLLDNAATLVMVQDEQGRVVRFNQVAERVTGYDFAELQGHHHWDVIPAPGKNRRERKKAFMACMRPGAPTASRFANTWLTKSGQPRIFEWFNSVVDGPPGQGRYIVSIGVDVTEQREVETQLRNSEARLRQAQKIARIASWEYDPFTEKLDWSGEVHELLGLSLDREPPSYEEFVALLRPEYAERMERVYEDSVENRKPYMLVHRALRPDDREIYLEEHGETIYRADGSPLLSRGTLQDVTESIESQLALRRSLAEKETLIREIHHRVKNNLQIISSLLYFESKKAQEPQGRDAFQTIRDRLRAMTMVHEKLYATNLTSVDLQDYIQTLVRDLTSSWWSEGSGKIVVDTTAPPLKLALDIMLPMGLILVEALTNARKYAFPEGRSGTIDIVVEQLDDEISLSVRDNGVGFEASFDPAVGGSFGWQLIGSLVRQLDGSVEVSGQGGVHLQVRFPYIQPAVAPVSPIRNVGIIETEPSSDWSVRSAAENEAI
ncbi:MAG: PAS domain S-box protein [Xanthomonadaceae bacterium]|nr:PAS domain S-box protein [Xanthomonadaceae bacterium]